MFYIYLDNASTTPMHAEVKSSMEPYFLEKFGNPGSVHGLGQEAIKAVDMSRENIARSVGADFRELIFTGSATEANNLALRGTISALSRLKPNAHSRKPKIIISAIEHESVLDTARHLDQGVVDVVVLPVDKEGRVSPQAVEKALDENTVLVSVMYANNETGVIQPIAEISQIVRDFRNSKQSHKNNTKNVTPKRNGLRNQKPLNVFPLFHTDAVQAFQFLNCDVNKLGVDMMTLSAHKIYGPKGVGALYVRKDKNLKPGAYFLEPIVTGGNQEFGFRSGTENVPSIVGFAKAVEIVSGKRAENTERLARLKSEFWKGIKGVCPKAKLNSPEENVLPNILNIYFPGQRADELLIRLDMAGIAASSGSACSSRSIEPSHVLKAVGFSKERVSSSLRFSLGAQTTEEDIMGALKKIREILK